MNKQKIKEKDIFYQDKGNLNYDEKMKKKKNTFYENKTLRKDVEEFKEFSQRKRKYDKFRECKYN